MAPLEYPKENSIEVENFVDINSESAGGFSRSIRIFFTREL